MSGNGLIVGTFGTKPLILGTAAQNRLTLAGDGKIGLGGVANPSQPLHTLTEPISAPAVNG